MSYLQNGLQVGLPVALILWLVVWPLRGQVPRWVHVALVAGCVGLAALFGQWLWPSAYLPYALAGLVLLGAVLGRRREVDRRTGGSIWPGTFAGIAALLAWAGVVVGVDARLRPAGDLVSVALPFAGAVLVTEGGRRAVINAHLAVMDPDSPSLSGWRGRAFGVELVPIDGWGRELAGESDVRMPCAGSVIGQGTDQRAGRYVMLDCMGVWVVLSGLTTVQAVDAAPVAAGAVVGQGARVVVHAQTPGTPQHPFAGDPLWISLDGVFAVRGMVLHGEN